MDNIRLQYLNKLLIYSRQKIWSEYTTLKQFKFEPFEWVNIHLINNAIEQESNTLFLLPNKAYRADYHAPTILILAISTFVKNWVENNDYAIGVDDVLLLSGGTTNIVYRIDGNTVHLRRLDGHNSEISITTKQARRFPIVTIGLKERKRKNALNNYKQFFKDLFGCEDDKIPYKFPNKTVVIANRKVSESLKSLPFGNSTFYKVVPHQYIWEKRDKSIGVDNNLLIEPMIYIANSYEVVKRYLKENQQVEIDNVIFIGSTKYKEAATTLSNDLNNSLFKSCVLIGQENMNSLPNMNRWTWEKAEIKIINGKKIPKPLIEIVEDKAVTSALQGLNNTIQVIEQEYEINLREINPYIWQISSQILPSNDSQIRKIYELKNEEILRKCKNTIRETFYDLDYDDEFYDCWDEIKSSLEVFINANLNSISKVTKLKELPKPDYLVVSKQTIDLWEKELNIGVKFITFSQYENLIADKPKRICFLNYFGRGQFRAMANSHHQHQLIINKHQQELFDLHLAKYEQQVFKEIQSEWRANLAGFKFKVKPVEENISDLVARFSEESKNQNDYYFMAPQEFSIQLEFTDTAIKNVSPNHSFWLRTGKRVSEISANSIQVGDIILEYRNVNKERLYQVALDADNNNTFSNIEKFANLWRAELLNHYEQHSTGYLNEYYQLFQQHKISISENTFKSWLQPAYKNKFPQKDEDLRIIQSLINSPQIEIYLSEIIKYKRIYKSMMIGLGHSLSDDVFNYLKSNRKGKIFEVFSEKQIQSIVKENIAEKIVKSKKFLNNTNNEKSNLQEPTILSRTYS